MDGVIDALQEAVDTARSAYFAERAVLQNLFLPLFREPVEVCNTVAGMAEEFGAAGAMSALDEPGRLGPLAEGLSSIGGEAREAIAGQLERLLDGRDRLDLTTAAREDHLQAQNPKHLRRMHFDGYEFVVDSTHGELRAVGDILERYAAPELKSGRDKPTLTEQLGKDVAKAQPTPERNRTRGR